MQSKQVFLFGRVFIYIGAEAAKKPKPNYAGQRAY
jgi:hypothetical protein